MNDAKKKRAFARELLRDERAAEAESRSLALSLTVLRRRKRQRRLLHWGLPVTAAAAALVAVTLVFQPSAPPESAREEGSSDSRFVRTRPAPEEVVFQSRSPAEVALSSRAVPAGFVARTDFSDTALKIIHSSPSDRLEFLTDRQLLAALEGRPVMLAETRDGGRRLLFLDERDRQLLWEP